MNKDFKTFMEQYHLNLDRQQAAAAAVTEGTVLLLAVPGSGKTTTLISRLGYMTMAEGISPREILAITYTVSGTEHMKEAYAERFGEKTAEQISFRTINGLSWGIVWQYYRSRNRMIGVCDEVLQRKIVRSLFKDILAEPYPSEAEMIEALTAISLVKNQMLTGEEIEKTKWKTERFPQLYQAYQNCLIERKLVDYDDQMIFALKILRADPALRERIAKRYRHISVDEAQDTSFLQHQILKQIAGNAGSLFLVGDEDQSIYGYRGACPKLLLDIQSHYPGARVMKLETNYRSNAEIVSDAKKFIDRCPDRFPKDMKASHGPGGRVVITEVKSRAAQRKVIPDYCRDGRETAILFRNNDSAAALADLFEYEKIPYHLNNPRDTFFSSRTVTEVKSFFQFALDLENPELFLKVYSRFQLYFTADSANRAIRFHEKNGRTLLDEFEAQFSFGKKKSSKLSSMEKNARKFCAVFQKLSRVSPSQAMEQLLGLGYGEYLTANERGTGSVEILRMIAVHASSAKDFLDRLDFLQKRMQEKGESVKGAVFLSTIHSAKGMEFERVILYDVIDGILPSVRKEDDATVYQEERRLFYVGVTRAKQELIVCAVTSNGRVSSFASELRRKETGKNQKPNQKQAQKKTPAPKKEKRINRKPDPHQFYRIAEDTVTGRTFQIQLEGNEIISAWKVNDETGEAENPCLNEVQKLYRKRRLLIR